MSKTRISYKDIINFYLDKDLEGKQKIYINLCGSSIASFYIDDSNKFADWLEKSLIPFLRGLK